MERRHEPVKIGIVTIAYNSGNHLAKLIEMARSSVNQVVFHLFLHSRHTQTISVCERFAGDPGVYYYPYCVNRGVSMSWNEGMINAYSDGIDVVLLVNDDIGFSAGDVDKLAEKALQSRESYIVTCAGFNLRYNQHFPSLGYACFAINPIALEKIGCFDENFFPAYCEDVDYKYRARLAGLMKGNCADTMVYHGGSSTIFSDPDLRQQNRLTHRRNFAYYRLKWGGDIGREIFKHPFNQTSFGYYISPEQRHRPYGLNYDRTDQDIVKV